jgi:hypothetical protein
LQGGWGQIQLGKARGVHVLRGFIHAVINGVHPEALMVRSFSAA